MALPQTQWKQCARFIASGVGVSINFTGTPDQLRTRIRNAIIAAGIENLMIHRLDDLGVDANGTHNYAQWDSVYNVRETYERMFGRDLITDVPL